MVAAITQRIGKFEDLIINASKLLYTAPTTVYGVAMGALSILTLGCSKKINSKIHLSTTLGNNLLNTSRSLLKIINPKAKFPIKKATDGIVFKKIALPIFQKASTFACSKSSFFKREVGSRLTFAVSTVASAVTALFDLAIGAIALGVSISTLGLIQKVNQFAAKQLSTGLVWLLPLPLFSLVNTVNPHADFSSTSEKKADQRSASATA